MPKYMDKLMSSQEPLGIVTQIKERKAKPIIATSQANIGDKSKKWKYIPIAINPKITDECGTPSCQSQSLKRAQGQTMCCQLFPQNGTVGYKHPATCVVQWPLLTHTIV
jgi:hypothetical protein